MRTHPGHARPGLSRQPCFPEAPVGESGERCLQLRVPGAARIPARPNHPATPPAHNAGRDARHPARRWPTIRRGRRIQGSLAPGSFAGYPLPRAGVAESVDAPDLGSGAARRRGSSPFTRTKTMTVPVFRCAVRYAFRPRSERTGCRFERPSVRHGLRTRGESGPDEDDRSLRSFRQSTGAKLSARARRQRAR